MDETVERVKNYCLATMRDASEVRYVRMHALDILNIIDPNVNWRAVAYGGSQ